MFDEAELRRMSPKERARLMQALACLDMPRLANAGSHAPERPSTLMASSPNSAQTPIIASSRARTYATTSIGSRSFTIGYAVS